MGLGFARCVAVALPLALAACNNAYRAPADGTPETWGEQHYLDVEGYNQIIQRHHHRH